MEKERFSASEQVWDRLVVSINNPPKRRSIVQQESVIALSMAVCLMLFINYETLNKVALNEFVYTNHSQLADPGESNFSSDAWTNINSKLQKEE